eukprot:UC4_evm1s622
MFQQWQAELLLFSADEVGLKGPITRIVSGCEKPDTSLKNLGTKVRTHSGSTALERLVSPEELHRSTYTNLRVHITPPFPGAHEFPWINKPNSINHWLKNADPPVTAEYIVLIDPDEVFMRPIIVSAGMQPPDITTGVGSPDAGKVTDIVRPGTSVAQQYGLGNKWQKILDVAKITGNDSPANRVSETEANNHYSVGPPYIFHISDIKKIAPTWVEYMMPVLEVRKKDIHAD